MYFLKFINYNSLSCFVILPLSDKNNFAFVEVPRFSLSIQIHLGVNLNRRKLPSIDNNLVVGWINETLGTLLEKDGLEALIQWGWSSINHFCPRTPTAFSVDANKRWIVEFTWGKNANSFKWERLLFRMMMIVYDSQAMWLTLIECADLKGRFNHLTI